ncbi:MAG: AAA family ATPase [Planctomycetaceae bacterium]|jgi:exonuclease SbcC|nr:AAA family ATPase [Planctomycetaceae bacterium]
MKIKSVVFQNLNSLVGTSTIHFPDSGVFAIVGPTGVGKTTILDAICLALYGRTPRLNNVVNSDTRENEIISRNTKLCFAEVEFETNRNKKYIARWEHNKTNKSAKPIHCLYTYTCGNEKQLLHGKTTDVRNNIQQISGLDFIQFTRSVMLAQGEFAKFLNSSDNERADILEKITGTEIYTNISKKVYEKFKNKDNNLKLLEKNLNEIKRLTLDEINVINNDVINLDNAIKQLSKRQNLITDIISYHKKLKEIQNESETIKRNIKSLDESESEFLADTAKLAAALKANEINNSYNNYTTQKKLLNEIIKKIAEIETNLPAVQNEFDEATKIAAESEKIYNETVNNCEINQKKSIAARSIDQKIDELISLIEKSEKDKNERTQKITKLEKELNKLEKNLSETLQEKTPELLQQKINEITTILTKFLNGKNISDWREERERLQNEIKKLELRHESIVRLESISTTQTEIESQIPVLNNSIQQLENQCTESEDQKILIEKYINELRDKKQLLAIIASLDEHREKLENGKPCPLCGACEHPYANGTNPKTANEESEIKDADKKIKNINQKLKQINEKLAETKRERDILEIKYNNNIELITQIVAKSGFGNDSKLADKNDVQIEINRIREVADKLKKQIDETEKLNIEQKELNEKLQKSHETNLEIQKIKVQIKEIKSENINTEKEIKDAEKEWELQKIERVKIFGNEIPDESDKKFERLLKNATKNRDNNNNIAITQKNKLDNLIRQREILLDEKIKRCIEVDSTKRIFEECYIAKGFDTEADFLSARIETKKLNELLAKENKFKEDRIRLNLLYDENIRKHKELSESEIAKTDNFCNENNIELLQKEKNELDVKIKEISEQVGGLKEKLNANKEKDEEYKIRQNEFEQSKQEHDLWFNLNELIGSQNGAKYSRIVQKMTFQSLITYANQQLSKITDRYRLIHAVSKNEDRTTAKEIMLDIIDDYQGGAIRTIKNLSGGEIFLVSLALALGLSSMVSERISVDSLFLDEGFGTLDEQTLDTVLSVLDSLRQAGKQIGIISHVPMIRQRITSQIRVLPKGNGQSFIEIALEGQ